MSTEVDVILHPLKQFLVDFNDYEIQRNIGKGSYGEVLLCRYKPTNKLCAVKKMWLDRLDGQNLTYYCREIAVLAHCHSHFLLQLHGFTKDEPYCIVTDYVPNGSLDDALRRKGKIRLGGTEKTSIALGIACGMASLHRQGIVHRDLKSLNILLDDRLLPKVCDFGISRYLEEAQKATMNIGSPHWMAPEMFVGEDYTNKVDVYAFGIVLWEMFTEDVPFKGLRGVQIGMRVNNGERPVIPWTCPEPLRVLIQQCWAQNPDDRPTFEDIYLSFAKGAVVFPATQQGKVDAVRAIAEKEMNLRPAPAGHVPPAPPKPTEAETQLPPGRKLKTLAPGTSTAMQMTKSQANLVPMRMPKDEHVGFPETADPKAAPKSMVYSTPHNKPGLTSTCSTDELVPTARAIRQPRNPGQTYSMRIASPAEPRIGQNSGPTLKCLSASSSVPKVSEAQRWEILKDLKHPDFVSAYEQTVSQLTIDQAERFFGVILEHFRSRMTMDLLVVLVNGLANLVKRNRAFIEPFMRLHGDLYMSYDVPRLVEPLVTLLCAAISAHPERLTAGRTYIQKLLNHVNGNEAKMLGILQSFPTLSSPLALETYSLFSRYSRAFLSNPEVGVRFLGLMHQMHQQAHDTFAPDALRVFAEALSTDDRAVIIYAYQCLCNMRCHSNDLPLHTVVQHMSNPEYAPLALTLIARLAPAEIPVSTRLIKQVIANDKQPASSYILLQVASKPGGPAVLMSNLDWLEPGRFSNETQLQACLFVVSSKEHQRSLMEDTRIQPILKQGLLDGKLISRIVSGLAKVEYTPKMTESMSKSGVLKLIIGSTVATNNVDLVQAGLRLFDTMARATYTNDYLDLIPYLPQALRMPKLVPVYAMSVIVVLSYNAQAMQLLIRQNIPSIVQELQLPNAYEACRADFLARCQQK